MKCTRNLHTKAPMEIMPLTITRCVYYEAMRIGGAINEPSRIFRGYAAASAQAHNEAQHKMKRKHAIQAVAHLESKSVNTMQQAH